MGWGRKTQVTTPIWYSAYPWWGLQQIVDRTKLRSELLNNDKKLDKLGKAGYDFVKKVGNSENMAKNTLEVYRKILDAQI